jgi:protein phosphatase
MVGAKGKAKMVALQLISAGLTDRGHERAANEDSILDYTGLTETGENFGLYIVCDGLGGHHAGDVASHMAVSTVDTELQVILPPMPPHHMNSADINHTIWTAVQRANLEIWYATESNELPTVGMGTTLTMAVVIYDTVHIAHVGDSRLYLLRDGKLEQLTQDHTMAAALAEAGQISPEEIVDHPRQNVLTRALGRQNTVEVDLLELPLLPGDMLLLCSDGFWKAFKGGKGFEEELNGREKTADLCRRLIEEANERDGSDNLSLIVVSAYKLKSELRRSDSMQLGERQVRESVPA